MMQQVSNAVQRKSLWNRKFQRTLQNTFNSLVFVDLPNDILIQFLLRLETFQDFIALASTCNRLWMLSKNDQEIILKEHLCTLRVDMQIVVGYETWLQDAITLAENLYKIIEMERLKNEPHGMGDFLENRADFFENLITNLILPLHYHFENDKCTIRKKSLERFKDSPHCMQTLEYMSRKNDNRMAPYVLKNIQFFIMKL